MIFRLETRLAPLAALVLALACVTACKDKSPATSASDELTVAAASDLTPAFEEIGREFEVANKTKVVFIFGSTGMLTRQIENGAPVDVFAAANVSYVDELDQKGLIIPDSKAIYARGRITLWTRDDSPIRLQGIADLARPEVQRIAIANPDHAPYGLAAKQALESAGIWDRVKPKLVFGDNIRQTMQYAETGNVEVAIVALSLSMQSRGRWTLIPEELHQPLDQGLAIIKTTKNEKAARAFAAFLAGPQSQAIMKKYGLTKGG
ncbi:MAG TPA: molybdate ABC transporter substrate-binding protein [Pyrinomonadaceae bacterium]|jgi:molybdate transport system substrate-binding protein|nr:molybdate ABC transporter substrate-binding protein [Pyrinomonadaceae bacterium]